jgi:hypothetical protein
LTYGWSERRREQLCVVGAALVVQVSHRGLDVCVTHPSLDLNDTSDVDRERTKSMAEVVKPQLPQAGGLERGEVAPAQGGAVMGMCESGDYGLLAV